MVSIIIPFYNASEFIEETLNSIICQSYKNFEIILINDNSKDNTEDIIRNYFSLNNDIKNFIYRNDLNMGVSYSRNIGLRKAKGEFVIFFDADDLMSFDFILNRVKYLINHTEKDACCSNVLNLYSDSVQKDEGILGVHADIKSIILGYKSGYSTCPSNYMFRKEILIKNNIFFNDQLNSSADKYFLLSICLFISIGFITNSPLIYRIHSSSMSHLLSNKLLADNRLFGELVCKNLELEMKIKKQFLIKISYILAGGYWKLKKIPIAIAFFLKYLFYRFF